jgi:hypothetical protein
MERSDEERESFWRQLEAIADALEEGQRAAQAVSTGGEPDLEALDRYADMLEAGRILIAQGRATIGWAKPTEDDVAAARHLVQLVRGGAPREALVEPARRVYRITADPGAERLLYYVLPWLAGEVNRIDDDGREPDPEVVRKMLDATAAFFERGGMVLGFVPTSEDLARVRRLRELVTVGGGGELAERHRLAKELWARLPQDGWVQSLRRSLVDN